MWSIKEFFVRYEEKYKLTGKQIAESLDISTALYSLIKSGKKPISSELIDKLSSLFDLSMDEIKILYLLSFKSNNIIKVNSNSQLFDYFINLIESDIKQK